MGVLLTESASLTVRETLTVLGGGGIKADVLSSGPVTIGRFSRWRGRFIDVPAPASDPIGYLDAVAEHCRSGRYDAVLATHEQGWLFAAGRARLPADAPIAVSSIESFDQVQGKIGFAALLDELALPQPRWWPIDAKPSDVTYPFWVKASFSNSGRGVRLVHSPAEERAAAAEMSASGSAIMGQASAAGQYGQVQALFEHGRLIAVHTCVGIGRGAGGSAAARLSVDHPLAREAAQEVGAHLNWHGGLTLDYLHVDGEPSFIECNPRTVEPGNAAASGVDLPRLGIALASRSVLPDRLVVGTAGVRTRSALALTVGAAERLGTRRAVLSTLAGCALGRGEVGAAREVLNPILRDPPSVLPLMVVGARLLARPGSVGAVAGAAVDAYAITPQIIDRVRAAS